MITLIIFALNLKNACLHLYCEQVAKLLTDEGMTFKMFFEEGFEVGWTRDIVKDEIWRPVQMAVCKEKSTTKPLTKNYNEIYKWININLSSKGFHIPWPSKETLALSNKNKND